MPKHFWDCDRYTEISHSASIYFLKNDPQWGQYFHILASKRLMRLFLNTRDAILKNAVKISPGLTMLQPMFLTRPSSKIDGDIWLDRFRQEIEIFQKETQAKGG